ncbi:MAG: DNA cytosine methyltransferase [Alphaproteobacteria bacterium]
MNDLPDEDGKPLTCVDLFSGAGGFSLAARQLGLHVRAAVESDPWACKTYHRNLIKGRRNLVPKLYEEDIQELDPKNILEEVFSDGAECDLVLGGPPCQGFSVHRINDAGKDDERNGLIHRYFDYVRVLRPKVFVMENVPGILWPRHSEYLDAFKREALLADYAVLDAAVLDARDYGVPQKRKRVFIVGVREGVSFPLAWSPPATHSKAAGKGLKAWSCASVAFCRAPKGDSNNKHMQHSADLVAIFEATPKNGGSRSQSGRRLPCHEEHDGHKDVYGRIDPRKPGPTMTTACVNPSKGRFVHPTQNHGITVRQAARLQSFPDSYVFEGGLMAAAKQVGNAVPVLLGKAVLRAVSRHLS